MNISEYESIESVHQKALFIEEHEDLAEVLLSHWCGDLEQAQKALEDDYHGCYESLADYAQELTEQTSEVPKHLEFYIDYEKMAYDMEMNGDVYTVETGFNEVHVFWSH